MKFFCPKCQDYHEDDQLAVSFDSKDNLLLKESLKSILTAAGASVSEDELLLLTNKISAASSNPIRIAYRSFPGAGALENGQKGRVLQLTTRNQAKNILEILWTLQEAGGDDLTLLETAIYACNAAADTEYLIKTICIPEDDIFAQPDAHGRSVLRKVVGCQKCCGICGYPLFECAGTAVEHVVGLLGSSRVAKSSSIIAAIYDLQYSNSKSMTHLHFEIPGEDAQQDERWENIIGKSLQNFKNCRRVVKTQTDLPGIQFIVTVVASRYTIAKGEKAEAQRTILTFVDIPGEYARKANEDKYLKSFGRLQKACRVFWYCFDYAQLYLLQYPVFKTLLDEMGYDGSNEHIFSAKETKNYLDLLARTVLRDEYIFARKMVHAQKPIAFILTKTDMYNSTYLAPVLQNTPLEIYPDDTGLKRQGNTEDDICSLKNREEADVLQLELFEQYTGVIEQYIRTANSSFWDQVRVFAAKSAFFATSAYGRNPLPLPREDEADGQRSDPLPFQAKLPVYWTLAVLGCHPVALRRQGKKKTEIVIAEQFSGDKAKKEAYHRLCSLQY